MYHTKLEQQRIGDINLNIALLDKPGTASLYTIAGTGLSTFDSNYADQHQKLGLEILEQPVVIKTLEAICAEFTIGRTIDFLKIDTEGTELQVLRGGDWKRFRPRVVLLEATVPLSNQPSHKEWEPFLLQQGYFFVYFDGLNRFYIRNEDHSLRICFGTPPNVFDSFVPYKTIKAEQRVEELELRLKSAMRKADKFDKLCSTLLGRIVSRFI